VRVLVAGVGYTGQALASRLAAAGHAVLALRRTPAPDRGGVRFLAGDVLALPDTALRELVGVEALAYLVAADRREEGAYRRAYVDGVTSLLARLRATASLRRVVYASSTSVYAQDDGSWVDESSPTEPHSFAGRLVLAGEQAARSETGAAVTALRLGGIYGPGRASWIERVRSGAEPLPAAPHYTNRIHRDDAAAAIAHLLELPSSDPCLLGVDSEPAERGELVRWLSARVGAPAPRAARDAAGPPSGKRCRNDRLCASGFRFRYPTFREGYGAILAASAA
jgi:nucleoside-diphosphate-sugar epimerase